MRSGSSSLMTTRSKSGRSWWRAMRHQPTRRPTCGGFLAAAAVVGQFGIDTRNRRFEDLAP
jgi:hypothetical protein